MKKRILLASGLLLATLPTAAFSQTPPAITADGGTLLDVTAQGQVTRTPDLASLSVGVETRGGTAAEAMHANAEQMSKLTAALKKAGIADRDIQTSSLSVSAQFRYPQNQPPELTGYQASNRLTVKFRDIDKAGTILDSLVAAGANQINGPTLSLSKPDEAMDAARVDAIRKARARAELYAKAAGLHVERILMISEDGLPSPTPGAPVAMMRGMVADAATKISPGEQDITATVSVRFLLR